MKILSIVLILIASLGVVTEFKSEKAVMDSIPRYAVIALFYVWGYLAQKYNEAGYKGGLKSISGVFILGVGVVGLVDSFTGEKGKLLFSNNPLIVILLLIAIFSVSVLLITYGHKQHRKLVSDKTNT